MLALNNYLNQLISDGRIWDDPTRLHSQGNEKWNTCELWVSLLDTENGIDCKKMLKRRMPSKYCTEENVKVLHNINDKTIMLQQCKHRAMLL